MIFTSHSDVKKSCHIVINNYYHSNATDAKGYYQDVVKRMTEDYKVFIDHAVYSSKQNFRLMDCTKYGKNRYKIFNRTWRFCDEEIIYSGDITEVFKSSLVSWIEDCKPLPAYEIEKKNKVHPLHAMTFDYMSNMNNPNRNDQREYRSLNNDEVREAFNIFKIYYLELTKMKVFPYKIRDVEQSRVTLNRTRPSYCPICKRPHESEHCSIFVSYSKKVYYKCFRDKDVTDTSLEVGQINNHNVTNNKNMLDNVSKDIKKQDTKNNNLIYSNQTIDSNQSIDSSQTVNLTFNVYDNKDKVQINVSTEKQTKILPDVLEGIKMMTQKSGYSHDIAEMNRFSNEVFTKK